MLAAGAAGAVEIDFIALSAADERDAKVYEEIWTQYGARIVAAFEARTCLPFAEPKVAAVVANATSHSGGPKHPMRLRSSYFRDVKQATLVHELGHRHLWQLVERLDGIDGHQTLFLILDRVWADVWGEKFAKDRIRGESEWRAEYDYAQAWSWARSLGAGQRTRLWNELLSMIGFANACERPLSTTAAAR